MGKDSADRVADLIVQQREADRRRVAGEIHDDTVQIMTAVGIRLHSVREASADPEVRRLCFELTTEVEGAIRRLRDLIFELRPPDDTPRSMKRDLEIAVEAAAQVGGFRTRIWGWPQIELEPPQIRAALKIAREALINVAHHAKAESVNVVLQEFADGILVLVRDDGAGFNIEQAVQLPGHIGLSTMRERAADAGGWVDIKSVEGQGTMVQFWIPATPRS